MSEIFKKCRAINKNYLILLDLIIILLFILNICYYFKSNHIFSYINNVSSEQDDTIKSNYKSKKLSIGYGKINEKFSIDEFGRIKRGNKILLLSKKSGTFNRKINEKHLVEYNNLKTAVLNHEHEYTFNAGSVSKDGYTSFIKDIWKQLRSEDGISQNVIFKTAKATGEAINGNYENLKISFSFDYNVDKNAEEKYKAQIKEIVSGFKNINTDYDKANAINSYLLDNANYAINEYKSGTKFLSDGMSIHSPYTLLEHKKGVCTAYAELFKLMATELGLETRVVTGDAFSFGKWGSHAWNIVKIDGNWYHCDTSWNRESDNPEFHNRYFLVGDDKMSVDHRWNKENFPSMSKIDQNHITIYNY